MSFLYKIFGQFLFWLYESIGSYGLAVVIFAVLAKLVLIPFTVKQMKSMKIMKELQPEIEKIQKKYADNKEKMNMEMQKLYQKHNYNPLSGCLPILLQFPIIAALFMVLRQPDQWVFVNGMSGVDMSFLWIQNLSYPDALNFLKDGTSYNVITQLPQIMEAIANGTSNGLYIFPILSVVSQILMTRMTTKTQSEQQQRQMKYFNIMMYVMIGYFSFTFPAGLAIYWFIQTALSAVQQHFMLKDKPKKDV